MVNPKIYTNVYYHCTKKSKTHVCSQGAIDENDLEEQIIEELDKVEINEDFFHWALEAIKYMHGDEHATQEAVVKNLEKKGNTLRSRMDQLFVMRADGEITGDVLAKMSKETKLELRDVEQEQKRLHNRMTEWLATANKYLTFAEQVTKKFNKASNEEKRATLEMLGSTIELIDKKLRVVAPNELIGFKNVYKKLGDDLGRFDNKKALDIQGLSSQKSDAFVELCAGRDSNLRRINPGDLQSPLVDRLSTDAYL